MCSKLEDCLFSRLGFRVCIISILILILGFLALNLSFHLFGWSLHDRPGIAGSSSQGQPSSVKSILLWTPLQSSWSNWKLENQQEEKSSQCEFTCAFTHDRTKLSTADLLLISSSDLKKTDLPSRVPYKHQLWGLVHASPSSSVDLSGMFFDLFISYLPQADLNINKYRIQENNKTSFPSTHSSIQNLFSGLLDSAAEKGNTVKNHISQHFSTEVSKEVDSENGGRMRREEDADADADANANDDELQSSNPKRKLNTRTRRAYHYDSRLVATLLDVCITNGNREGYMKELAVHVQVHTYGNCGVPCPGNSTSECLQYLSKFYKFLLVFEADICEHYVSNLVYQVLQTSMVPVVFGGGDYSKDLQPGSYIDAMPQTPENLAHFLIYLDKHQPVFNTYTQWKEGYRILEESWSCNLCRLLHAKDSGILRFRGGGGIRGTSKLDRCTRWPSLEFSVHQ